MRRSNKARQGWAVLWVGSAVFAASAAHAETVLAQTGLISGAQSFVFALEAPTAGTFSVKLSDLTWPDRLSTLSFAGSTATTVLNRVDISGSSGALSADSSFKVNQAGNYYALVSGTAQGALNMGLYSLKVDFAPVPLPAAALLLFSGLAGFAATQRKRHVLRLA